MPEPPTKKQHTGYGRPGAQRTPAGSAIIFWHEAEGSPPGVRAIALRDLEPLEPGTSVTEKTVCRAKYRGASYHCLVIWIEEGKFYRCP